MVEQNKSRESKIVAILDSTTAGRDYTMRPLRDITGIDLVHFFHPTDFEERDVQPDLIITDIQFYVDNDPNNPLNFPNPCYLTRIRAYCPETPIIVWTKLPLDDCTFTLPEFLRPKSLWEYLFFSTPKKTELRGYRNSIMEILRGYKVSILEKYIDQGLRKTVCDYLGIKEN